MSLFVLSSKDGWVSIMYDGLDAVAVDKQVCVCGRTCTSMLAMNCSSVTLSKTLPRVFGSCVQFVMSFRSN